MFSDGRNSTATARNKRRRARLWTLSTVLCAIAISPAAAQDPRFWTEQLKDKPQSERPPSDRPRARQERRPEPVKAATKGLEPDTITTPRPSNDGDRTAIAALGKRNHIADNVLATESLTAQLYSSRDRTAFGETLTDATLVCAHAWLPVDSTVLVTDTATGRAVIVKVKDRTHSGRSDVIELSKPALAVLGGGATDRGKVRLTVLWVPTGEPQFWPRPRVPGVQAVSAD